ncbi:calmodulin-related protein 97A [Biomphalaria pfeifferi]|uniref:Calmodulin-related protein 97A n=1 Tax=Biomphalaria pfeifferi TaxID=112525 RepID=A0AAD8BMJ5_BIOPF|nr:calmodulin-related protein 97A [Biomphalaria pfeifferi]
MTVFLKPRHHLPSTFSHASGSNRLSQQPVTTAGLNAATPESQLHLGSPLFSPVSQFHLQRQFRAWHRSVILKFGRLPHHIQTATPATNKMSQTTKNFEEKCRRFFEEANGGNPITVGQLARVIRQACPTFQGTDADIAQTFLELDDNNDKLVSWEEFSSALYAKDPREVTRAELEQAFKDIDKDGSGKLDKNEIRLLCQQQGLDISEEQLNEVVKEADDNNDGKISFEEFENAFVKG